MSIEGIGAKNIYNNSINSNGSNLNKVANGGNNDFLSVLNTASSETDNVLDLDKIFEEASERYDVPVSLLKAVGKAESSFRTDVVSSAGAIGVMQLMPRTAKGLGVTDPYDPQQNIMGGAKYLRQMLDRYDGDVELALAAYNSGPGTVDKHNGIPSFTQGYINRVLGFSGETISAGSVSVELQKYNNVLNSISNLSQENENSSIFQGETKDLLTQMLFLKALQESSPDNDVMDMMFYALNTKMQQELKDDIKPAENE